MGAEWVHGLPSSFATMRAPAIRRRPPDGERGLLLRVDCGYLSDVSARCAVAVPPAATFADLIGALEGAYELDGGHLSEVSVPPKGTPRGGLTTESGSPKRTGRPICWAPGGDFTYWDVPEGALYANEEHVSCHLGVGWAAWWLYDFGDMHYFAVRALANIDKPELTILRTPGSVPVEDSGHCPPIPMRERGDFTCYEEALT